MSKVIRLTESDLVKIVRRVVKEEEETKACSVSVGKLLQHLKKVLTPEEEKLLISTYQNMGEDDFKDEVEDVLSGNNINENRARKRELERVINKVANVVFNVSLRTMPAGILLGACLSPDNPDDITKPMEIVGAISAGVGVLSIPLLIIAFFVAASTRD